MSILKFLSGQFVDVIDWTEQPGELAIRYPLADRAMTNGTQLTVRDGQVAVFHDEGQIADVFGPGRHVLETSNLPILTALLNWDKGFVSPFKSDLYFYTTKDQLGLTWGTSQPVTVRDAELGKIEVRAFGRYSFCVANIATFSTNLMGTLERLTVADVEPQLRAAIATAVATDLGRSTTAFAELARDQAMLSRQVRDTVQPAFHALGLECTAFFVESLSLAEDSGSANDVPTPGNAAASADDDSYQLIERLHELFIADVLSKEEYEAKKAQLLARIR